MAEVFNLTTAHRIEREIVRALIKAAFKAGYRLGVNDGEETVLENSNNQAAVEEALCSTDEDFLLVYDQGDRIGWVQLIWGNRADVISDYSTRLEDVTKAARDLAEEYE